MLAKPDMPIDREDMIIRAFGLGHLIGKVDFLDLMDLAVKDTFANDLQGLHVEYLRGIFKAFREGHDRRSELYLRALQMNGDEGAEILRIIKEKENEGVSIGLGR